VGQRIWAYELGQGNAYRLPITGKADLQKALNDYQIVVLDKGDYTVPNSTVTLKSGYQLYGDPVGTSLPPVIFAPVTTGALLSTVTVKGGVTFPASSQITSGNAIERLIGGITVAGGRVKMLGTPEGDGSVSWASGRIDGIGEAYLMDAAHGDLADTVETDITSFKHNGRAEKKLHRGFCSFRDSRSASAASSSRAASDAP
jgi:hypothetical protein